MATECDTSGGFQGCFTDVRVSDDGSTFVADFETDFALSDPGSGVGNHLHIFLNPPTSPENAGNNGPSPGSWMVYGGASPVTVGSGQTVAEAVAAGASELCVVVADSVHGVVPGTGNCIDITSLEL